MVLVVYRITYEAMNFKLGGVGSYYWWQRCQGFIRTLL